MSNIIVPRSTFESGNLIIMNSRVVGKSLIINENEAMYVERFAPRIMDGNETADALYGTEKDEFVSLTDSLTIAAQNSFIKTMGIKRIRQWENLLDIAPSASSTMEDRKENIRQKMFARPPYTRQNFQQFLHGLYGDGNYTFEIYPDEFAVVIDVHDPNVRKYLKFERTVRMIIPANMQLILSIMYTHLYLNHEFRYREMESLTYGDLSQYAETEE